MCGAITSCILHLTYLQSRPSPGFKCHPQLLGAQGWHNAETRVIVVLSELLRRQLQSSLQFADLAYDKLIV